MGRILIGFLAILVLNLTSCDQLKAPDKLSKERIFELSAKCAKEGKAYFDDFWRSTNYSGAQAKTKYMWDDPEYHYSQKLNTCLIHARYIEYDQYESHVSRQYNQVIDIFSNKTLLRGWFTRDVKANTERIIDVQDGIPNVTSTEYFRRKDQLFKE